MNRAIKKALALLIALLFTLALPCTALAETTEASPSSAPAESALPIISDEPEPSPTSTEDPVPTETIELLDTELPSAESPSVSPEPTPYVISEIWDGTIATSYAGGTGTQGDPYLISTGSQLALLAKEVNLGKKNGGSDYLGVYFKQTCDIDLNSEIWDPIGGSRNKTNGIAFMGTYDADGYHIANLSARDNLTSYLYTGLFGYVGYKGSVKNIKLTGHVSAYSQSGLSSFVGSIAGMNDGYIENCEFQGTVIGNGVKPKQSSTEGNSIAGGITGKNTGAIVNCHVTAGEIQANGQSSTVGGISGFMDSSLFSTTFGTCIINCSNMASLSGSFIDPLENVNGNSATTAGGIAGQLTAGRIVNCMNAGSIIAPFGVEIRATAGGIVGAMDNMGYGAKLLRNCVTIGDINGSETNSGALAGSVSVRGLSIIDCYYAAEAVSGSGKGVGIFNNISATEPADESGIHAVRLADMKKDDFLTKLDNGAIAYNNSLAPESASAKKIASAKAKTQGKTTAANATNTIMAVPLINATMWLADSDGINGGVPKLIVPDTYVLPVCAIALQTGITGGGINVLNGNIPLYNNSGALYGTRLTISGAPAQNYELSSLTVNGKNFESGADTDIITDLSIRASFKSASVVNYTVSYPVSINGGAIIVKNGNDTVASGTKLPKDTVLTISATPATGYRLTNLKVNGEDFVSGATHTLTANATVSANFAIAEPGKFTVTFPVTVTGGTLSVTSGTTTPVDTGDILEEGTVLTIIATPATGYKLSTLTVNGNAFTSGTNYTITSDTTIAVSFMSEADAYTVTFPSAPTGGTVSVLDEGGAVISPNDTVPSNTVLTITATPASSYVLKTLTVNGAAFTSGAKHTVSGNVVIICTFELSTEKYKITFPTSLTGGTVKVTFDVDDGETPEEIESGDTVPVNTEILITATPNTGYTLSALKVNGTAFTSGDVHEVTKATVITATFTKAASYKITFPTSLTGGTITVKDADGDAVSNGTSVPSGTVLTIRAASKSGYKLASLKVNGSSFTSGKTYTVTKATTISATFTKSGTNPATGDTSATLLFIVLMGGSLAAIIILGYRRRKLLRNEK